jgi:PrtD family type I secretion system ABC transporter
MKSMWKELRPQLMAIAAFSFFINLLFVIPAIYMLQVFDRVLPGNSRETLIVLSIGALIALGILMLLDYVRGRLQNLLGTIIDERLSPPVVNTIVARAARLPNGPRNEGIRDVQTLRSMFSTNGLIALFDAPWVVIYILVIGMFHPALGVGAAIAAMLMVLLAWLNDRFSRSGLEELQKGGRRAAHYVESSMRNAEVLQALGMTENLLSRWRKLQDQVAATQIEASRSTVSFMAMTKTLRQAIQMGILALGAYLVITQRGSPGIMVATTVLLGRAVQPVEQLVASWRMLAESRAAYRRLSELSAYFDREDVRVALERPEGELRVDNIVFRAPGTEKPILAGISFALKAGEALAIVGPSAGGKSTLARLLTGVWHPSTGTVRLDGADVAHWPRQTFGPWIGYVPQDVELFEGTVADNIARLGEVDSAAVIKAAKRANAHDLILGLAHGYDTPVGEGGARLSPGQRQRIALARALFGDPRLVILDEPNANLDGDGEIALARSLSSLRIEGITSIVVTHRPSLIAHVDKILMLSAGRIQKFGTAAEVMKELQQQAQKILNSSAA